MKKDPLSRRLSRCSTSSASIARHCPGGPSLPPGASVPRPLDALSPHPHAAFHPHTTRPVDCALHPARNRARSVLLGRAPSAVLLGLRSCTHPKGQELHHHIFPFNAHGPVPPPHTGEDGGDRGAVQDALGGRHPGKPPRPQVQVPAPKLRLAGSTRPQTTSARIQRGGHGRRARGRAGNGDAGACKSPLTPSKHTYTNTPPHPHSHLGTKPMSGASSLPRVSEQADRRVSSDQGVIRA